MTRTQKLMGIAVAVLMAGGGMGAAVRAARSPVAMTSAKIANGPRHACVEGTFEWRWNIPFASTCDAQPD
jgi:hypothetical protein